ncbi:cupin domain-containing protein [Chryseobacterium indoltheticum]|uniref:cupin domain-containing protein n=1 Tax=Chryseobacterium indoltheticum TaxID=254 RepID=UPI000E1FD571|nr:cupin domain-containing protein [Chryseobacterium indoltheticum]
MPHKYRFYASTASSDVHWGWISPQVITDAFEYKYIISGEVSYMIGNETYNLSEGDSLFFDGRLKHVPINKCKNLVKC